VLFLCLRLRGFMFAPVVFADFIRSFAPVSSPLRALRHTLLYLRHTAEASLLFFSSRRSLLFFLFLSSIFHFLSEYSRFYFSSAFT